MTLDNQDVMEIRQTSGPKAPPGPPRSTPARDPSAIATELYRSMKGDVWGFGTRADALSAALGGLTPAQLDDVRAHYGRHYGRSLDDDIRQELRGLEEWRADQILSGKPAVADAERLRKAVGRARESTGA